MADRKILLFPFVIFILLIQSATAQPTINTEIDWEDKLFEKDVKYENYACRADNKKIVSDFFEENPLNRILRVCHNNCAILVSFPQGKLPLLPPKIAGQGYIAVHVLVDEDGRPLFARALNGHFILRRLLEKRGCEAKFEPTSTKRQKVVIVCPNDVCREMQPVDLRK